MKNIFTFSLIAVLFIISCKSDDSGPKSSDSDYDGYTLIWSDEFNANLNSSNWNFELGDGTAYGLPPGWGNSERQLYTDSGNNASIQPDEEGNSTLVITARKEPGNNKYSSAKVTTQNLQGFRFGRIEARIKVPEGRGMWPAFWLLGDNRNEIDWPGCGEIDIMEVIGHEPNVWHSSVHYTNSENKTGSETVGYDAGANLAADYHIYRLDWTPTEMEFSLNGTVTHTAPIENDMKEFLRSFYIIFNVAVGGNWPGNPDETTTFPQKMQIDWVRYYTKDDFNPPAPPELDIEEETLGQISLSLPPHAFNDNLGQFSNMIVKSFGDGGEPEISTSTETVDGDSSLVLNFPGDSWGGAFFIVNPTVDVSQFQSGNLKFSLKVAPELSDIEIKLESVATAVSLFLINYSGEDVGNGFLEYTIPMTDFEGLDITDLKIPFALWNPVDANGEFIQTEVLLDNIYFEE